MASNTYQALQLAITAVRDGAVDPCDAPVEPGAEASRLVRVADSLMAGRGLHSFPFPLNLSLLCPCPLNLSLLRPQHNPT